MTPQISRRVQRRPTLAEARAARRKAEQFTAQLAERERLELQLQLANGDTCIRIAAERRGITTGELKRLVYGGAA